MNIETIPKKILNMKAKGKCPKERWRSRWEQQVKENVIQKEGRTQEETEDE
jgi:hypothetical protein